MYGDPRPLNCNNCGATFDNEKTRSNHTCTNVDFPIQRDDAGNFECKHCNKRFDRRKGNIFTIYVNIKIYHYLQKNSDFQSTVQVRIAILQYFSV